MSNLNNRILLVDDDIELTQLISQYLHSNGYEVECIHQGENITKIIDNFQPDVIVLDLMLPGVDGLTICKNIRDRFQGAIIMLTALGDDIDEVTGLEVGADDYLAKPIKPRLYSRTLERKYADKIIYNKRVITYQLIVMAKKSHLTRVIVLLSMKRLKSYYQVRNLIYYGYWR